ncbi:MAG: membrane dipeptidase [Acidimicrobiia bacterium]|nr:membrane dipeptidase [Acidimicrobiia bacterium]
MKYPILAVIAAATLVGQTRAVSDAEVERVHRSALLIDTHNDVTSDTVKGLDIGPLRKEGHTDLVRLKQGGVGAVFFAAYVSGTYVQGNRSAHRTMEMIDTIRHDIVGRNPNGFELALTAGDIVAARKKGKIAALIGIEGGHGIEDSLRLLRDYYALGVRYMTLTHSNSNNWADSSGDAKKPHGGLNDLGRKVVAEMNRLGMMVDISHVADDTFWDALETSRAPIFASHSSCRKLANIPRNMTDEMIVALAKKGGVVQINFGCEFLSQKSVDTSTWSNPKLNAEIRARAEREATDEASRRALIRKLSQEAGHKTVPATLSDAVAHIDHIVKIAGIDAAGIGSDYDGVSCVPVGLEDVSKFPALTRALLERGYTAEQIHKIYGGNLLRVMRAVEQAAAKR